MKTKVYSAALLACIILALFLAPPLAQDLTYADGTASIGTVRVDSNNNLWAVVSGVQQPYHVSVCRPGACFQYDVNYTWPRDLWLVTNVNPNTIYCIELKSSDQTIRHDIAAYQTGSSGPPYYGSVVSRTNCPWNTAPNTPNLVSPANGSTTTSGSVTLQLQDTGDPDNYPHSYRDYEYRIEKTDGSWGLTWAWPTATSWNVTLPSPGTYQWRARSGDGELASAYTAWWTINYTVVPTYGWLTGRITDASNGAGLSGARIAVGDRTALADGNGNYSIMGLPVGPYNFVVTKDGFNSYQANVTIGTSGTTKDAALTPHLAGMTRPVSPFTSINSFRDQHSSAAWVYDYFHPVGSPVNINGRWYLAPWPAGKWRVGIAYNGHSGTDFKGVLNSTNVIAATDGYVVQVRDQDPNYNKHLPGNFVIMRHTVNGRTFYAIYAHLQRGTIPAQIKQARGRNILIPRGTPLGRVGMSGNTSGPHLHFGVSNCSNWCGTFDPYEAGLWAAGNNPLQLSGPDFSYTVPMTDDNVLPTAAFTVSALAAQINTSVTFDASASQDPDGALVQYLWDFGDGTQAQGMSVTHTYTTAVGTYYVFLIVADDAGGAALADAQAVVVTTGAPSGDLVPPQGEFAFVGTGATAALTATATLTLTTAENPPNIQVRFSTDGATYGSWQTFASQITLPLSNPEGTQTFYVQFADAAGNQSWPVASDIVRDTTPPTLTVNLPITDTLDPGNVYFAWAMQDAGEFTTEPLNSEYLLVSVDSTWRDANGETFAAYSGLADGTYTFFVRVTDWAGNQTTTSTTAQIHVPDFQVFGPFVARPQ